MTVKNPLDYVDESNSISSENIYDKMYPRVSETTNHFVFRRFTSSQREKIGHNGWILDKAQSGWPKQKLLEQTDNNMHHSDVNQGWMRYRYLDPIERAIDWCPGFNGLTSFWLETPAQHVDSYETIEASYDMTKHNLRTWGSTRTQLHLQQCEARTVIETVKQLDWTHDCIRFGSFSSELIFSAIQEQIQATYLLFNSEPGQQLLGMIASMNYKRFDIKQTVGKPLKKPLPIFKKDK